MNDVPTRYVTNTDMDIILTDIIDFVGTCYDSHEKNLIKVNNKLSDEINKVRLDLQTYQENNSKIFAEMRKDIDEIKKSNKKIDRNIEELKAMHKELKKSNEELKDMNRNILGMIAYQDNRLREIEKKAHTHSTDML